jgi:hypothetical protein
MEAKRYNLRGPARNVSQDMQEYRIGILEQKVEKLKKDNEFLQNEIRTTVGAAIDDMRIISTFAAEPEPETNPVEASPTGCNIFHFLRMDQNGPDARMHARTKLAKLGSTETTDGVRFYLAFWWKVVSADATFARYVELLNSKEYKSHSNPLAFDYKRMNKYLTKQINTY